MTKPSLDRPGLWWLAALVTVLTSLYCFLGFLMNAWLTATPSATPRHAPQAYALLAAAVLLMALSAYLVKRAGRARSYLRKSTAAPLRIPRTKRLNISTPLFEELYRRQALRGYSDEIVVRLGAVWLHTDLGPSWYVTREGQVFEHDVTLNEGLRILEPPRLFTALVAGARTLDAEELLTLLPPRSVASVDCSGCAGQRRVTLGTATTAGMPTSLICTECAGLGWTLGELTVLRSSVGWLAAESFPPSQDWEHVPVNGLAEPVQFFRAEVAGPRSALAVVCNHPATAANEDRARMLEALRAQFPGAIVGFMESDAEGSASVSSFGATDPPLIAFVVAVFKASCGWDESEVFAVEVDGATVYARVNAQDQTWCGTSGWNKGG